MSPKTKSWWKFLHFDGKETISKISQNRLHVSLSDRYLEENLSTLNYAARASLISNVPTKNIDPRIMEIDDQKVLNVLLTSIEKNIKLRERASQCQLTYTVLESD